MNESKKQYTKDGEEWKGPTHSHDGQVMTGSEHTDDSQNLYSVSELSDGVQKKVLANKKLKEDLRKWFGKGKKGDWVRVGTDGEIKGDCAREPGEGKPKCMPRSKAHSMSKDDRASAARRKRRADPEVDRPGTGNTPIMVKTDKEKKKVKEEFELTLDEGTVQISFRSVADKRKWMKKQSIAVKEIVKQTPTFVELPAGFKKYAKKEDHPEIYQVKESVEQIDEKNVPTKPALWAKFKAQAKAKFDVYPSAYANGWAAKQYKAAGGGWKKVNEETEINEKSDYQIYHKDFTSAVQHAMKQAEKRGYKVDMDDWWNKVSSGPRKPSAGKTNSYQINLLDKSGKPIRNKRLNMQVYNMDNKGYELNMYTESVELDEAKYSVDVEGLPRFYMDGDSPGKVKVAVRKLLKKVDLLKDVERVNDAKIKKDLRLRLSGKSDIEGSEVDEEFEQDPLLADENPVTENGQDAIDEASLRMKIAARGKVESQLKKMKHDDAEMAAFLVNQGDLKELQKFLKTADKKVVKVASQVFESAEDKEPASPDEKSMALKQAEFIMYVGKEIGEHLKGDKEFPEWMQNKLSALHEKAKDMHSTLGAHGMDEATIKLDTKKLKVGDKVKTSKGTVEIVNRPTKRSGEDAFKMILHARDGKKYDMGSHPGPSASAVQSIVSNSKLTRPMTEASKVPAGMKFLGGHVYKGGDGEDHKHTYYSKGGKMTSPVVVHIDGKEWKTFDRLTKAKQAAISHIKGMKPPSKFRKEEVELDEKAVSKAQQRFMGMVHAVKSGKLKAPSKEVADAAKSMTKKDAKDYAETKHKGLPEKK